MIIKLKVIIVAKFKKWKGCFYGVVLLLDFLRMLVYENPLSEWGRFIVNLIRAKLRYRGNSVNIGYMSTVDAKSQLEEYVTLNRNIKIRNSNIGKCTYVADDSIINNASIGSFCSIGPGVKMGLGSHPVEMVSTHPLFYSTLGQAKLVFADKNYFTEYADIKIGSDVWIGANCILKDGVEIGNGAVVAAGAVVVSNIEPYSIVGGVPAKLLRKRFDQNVIDQIEGTKWWSEDINTLKERYKLFHDVDLFIDEFSK